MDEDVEKSPDSAVTRRRLLYWGGIALGLIGLIVAVAQWGYPACKDYRLKRGLRNAEVFIAGGDYRSAYLLLERLAGKYPASLEARRAYARVIEAYGMADSLPIWKALVAAEPRNVENLIGYATALLRLGRYQEMSEVLSALRQLHPDGVEYRRLAAGMALGLQDREALQREVEALARLRPEDPMARFNLAAVLLASPTESDRRAGRAQLAVFAKGDRLRIRAMLALIADSVRRWPEQRDLNVRCGLLAAELDLPNQTRLPPMTLRATTLKIAPLHWPSLLVEFMQAQPEPMAADVAALARWMIQIGQTREALVWLEAVDTKIRRAPEIMALMADCSLQLGQWGKLEQLLLDGAWGPASAETVRAALTARKLQGQNEVSRAEAAWGNAIRHAGASWPDLRLLLRVAQAWGWSGRESQVLWLIVKAYPAESWAWRLLAGAAVHSRDSKALWEVYEAWAKAAPGDQRVQAEKILAGLLIRPMDPALVHAAEQLFRQNQGSPLCRGIWSLGLWRSGRTKEALDALGSDLEIYRNEPRLVLVCGLVLASAGKKVEGEQLLTSIPPEILLPEEAALVASVRSR